MSLTHIWLVIAGFLYIEIIILAPGSEYLSSTMAHLHPGKASGMCISPPCPGRSRRIRTIHPIMKLSWKQASRLVDKFIVMQACVWLLKYNHRHNQIRMPCICTFHYLHFWKVTISKCDHCVVWLSSASTYFRFPRRKMESWCLFIKGMVCKKLSILNQISLARPVK